MEMSSFAIQPCQSKFTFWNVEANKNFREFVRFFQTGLTTNKFGQNSKIVLLLGILIRIMFRIGTFFQKEIYSQSFILSFCKIC
jgi:hypothetical protein